MGRVTNVPAALMTVPVGVSAALMNFTVAADVVALVDAVSE